MIRVVLYLLGIIILISVIRSVAGVLGKFFTGLAEGQGNAAQRQPPVIPAGGELKKDPVCGTFISTSTSLKKTVDGTVVHFCSAACRDKFRG